MNKTYTSILPFLTGAPNDDKRQKAAEIIDNALRKEGIDINTLCQTLDPSPVASYASYNEVLANHFNNVDPATLANGGGPLAILVLAGPHNGKSMVGSGIESYLINYGFENVKVHQPEDNEEARYQMAKKIDNGWQDPAFKPFLKKPILLVEINVPRSTLANPAANDANE